MLFGDSDPPVIPTRSGLPELFTFTPVSEHDVSKLVTKSKSGSCAADPLPTKLVKEYIEELLPIITHIINRSLISGSFASEWKTALVMPLLKKTGLELIPKNYRPVSNLQFISKLVEKAVVNQLCQHMNSAFPLPVNQSAYRVILQNLLLSKYSQTFS